LECPLLRASGGAAQPPGIKVELLATLEMEAGEEA